MGESQMPRRRGRAAASNPSNRFDRLHVQYDPAELDEEELRQVQREVFRDDSSSILSKNDSPDVPFTYSVNPYRGCEHGCIYCYARPTHEYLGFSAGLDFETKIVVKENAPDLLSARFQKRSWTPQVISFAGNTDVYQPLERSMQLTRRCLEVCLRHRNPVAIVTKNGLVTRDLDILEEMASMNLVRVVVSLTTLRADLVSEMEPRTARPSLRLKTIRRLREAGVPVGVLMAPLVPGLNDEEMPAVLEAAAEAGADAAGYVVLRLPGAVKELFLEWLRDAYPNRVEKVTSRLRSLRGEELNDTQYGRRMRGEGPWADAFRRLFRITARKHGLDKKPEPLSTERFRRLPGGQLDLL